MTKVTSAIAIVALMALGASIGDVLAATNFQCSQRYFTAHEQCIKRNSRELCARVLGDRKAACLKTGCWRTARANTCGYSRL
jgi:hypothetical protein